MIPDRIKNAINLIYSQRRLTGESIRLKNIDEYHEKYPKLREIDDDLIAANIEIALSRISFNDSKINMAQTNKEKVIQEKTCFLNKNKIPADYDSAYYHCDICRDTGFELHKTDKKCVCYYEILIPKLREYTAFHGLDKYTFDEFRAELFSSEKNEEIYRSKNSPREQITAIKSSVLNHIQNLKDMKKEGIFFTGGTGTGKTFLAGCIANKVIEQGLSVLYFSAPKLFEQINEYKTLTATYNPDRTRLEDYQSKYYEIFEIDFLVIDDLGTEAQTSQGQPDLLEIINRRAGSSKKTLITTNLDGGSMQDYYDERIISRIYGEYAVYRFFGPDLRLNFR